MQDNCTPKRPNWQTVVLLFFLGWTFIYANRNVLSAVLRDVGTEWGLNRTQLGLLNSAFFLAYTAGQLPTGFLADKFSRRALLLPGYYVQSIACMLAGLAQNPGLFLASRIASGTGQSTYYASQYALAAQYLPAGRRAFGMAAINSGMAGGVIAGLLLGSYLVYGLGLSWRIPFLIVGAVGVLIALAIQLNVTESVSRASKTASITGVRQPFLSRDFWLVWLSSLGGQYGFYLILSWLPFYLQEVRGFPGATAGVAASLMPIVAGPSSMAIGFFSDRLGKRKPIALAVVPISTVALLLIGLTSSTAFLYAGLILYGLAGKMSLDPILVSMVTESVPGERRATALGILNFAATISMVAAPLVTGYLADLTGSFVSSFYVAIFLSIVCFVSLAFIREPGKIH